MVRLELAPEEAEMLRNLVQARLNDMRKEIAHTATREFRGKLKIEEALLERLLKEIPVSVHA